GAQVWFLAECFGQNADAGWKKLHDRGDCAREFRPFSEKLSVGRNLCANRAVDEPEPAEAGRGVGCSRSRAAEARCHDRAGSRGYGPGPTKSCRRLPRRQQRRERKLASAETREVG